jgi:sugar phosphate permease
MGKLSWQGIYAFTATYVAYFSLYLIRKPVGASIPYIKQEFSICSKLVLSIIPNCHLLPYSFTGILLPNLVDRFGGKKSLTFTFGGAGLSVAAIYLTKFFATNSLTPGSLPPGSSTPDSYSESSAGLVVFCVCIFCGGFFQAFGWPSAVKSLAEHIPAEPRKALIPVWTTCCFIGSTVGGLLLGSILMGQKNGFHDDGFCENSWNGTECTDEQFRVT